MIPEDERLDSPQDQQLAEDLADLLEDPSTFAGAEQRIDGELVPSELSDLVTLATLMRERAPELLLHFQAESRLDEQFSATLRSSLVAQFGEAAPTFEAASAPLPDTPAESGIETATAGREVAARHVFALGVQAIRQGALKLRTRLWLLGVLAVALAIGLVIAVESSVQQPAFNGARGRSSSHGSPTEPHYGAPVAGGNFGKIATRQTAVPGPTRRGTLISRPPQVYAAPTNGQSPGPVTAAAPHAQAVRPFALQSTAPLIASVRVLLPPHLIALPSSSPLFAVRHASLTVRSVAALLSVFGGKGDPEPVHVLHTYLFSTGTLQVATQQGKIEWTARPTSPPTDARALPGSTLVAIAQEWLKRHTLFPKDVYLPATKVFSTATSMEIRFAPALPNPVASSEIAVPSFTAMPQWLSVTITPQGTVLTAVSDWPVLVQVGTAALSGPSEAARMAAAHAAGASGINLTSGTVFTVATVRLVYEPVRASGSTALLQLRPDFSFTGSVRPPLGAESPLTLLVSALKQR